VSLSSSDLALLAAPFAAGLVVVATHVPLGMTVLRRGIIFIDLAIAQVAALGVIGAGLLHLDDLAPWVTQFAAGLAALAAAALLTFCERCWPEIQEALIGLLFVFAAAAGIVLLAGSPHGGEHLRDLLSGQILWADWRQITVLGVLSVVVLAMRAWLRQRGDGFPFYALFAIAVTASVQLVGVLLVFASLIAPAVATSGLPGTNRSAAAFAIGALGYGVGLVISLLVDMPAGAAVACTLVLLAAVGLSVWNRASRQ